MCCSVAVGIRIRTEEGGVVRVLDDELAQVSLAVVVGGSGDESGKPEAREERCSPLRVLSIRVGERRGGLRDVTIREKRGQTRENDI